MKHFGKMKDVFHLYLFLLSIFLTPYTSLNYAQHLKAEFMYLGVPVINLNYSFVPGELEI